MKLGSQLFRRHQPNLSAAALVFSIAAVTLVGCSSESTTSGNPTPSAPASAGPGVAPVAQTAEQEKMPKSDKKTQYSIDEVQGKTWDKKNKAFDLKASDVFVISGWAVDSVNNEPAPQVYFCIDDGSMIPGTTGVSRPDLAQGFKIPSWGHAGYTIKVDCSKLAPGSHKAALRIVGHDKTYFYEPDVLTLNIKS